VIDSNGLLRNLAAGFDDVKSEFELLRKMDLEYQKDKHSFCSFLDWLCNELRFRCKVTAAFCVLRDEDALTVLAGDPTMAGTDDQMPESVRFPKAVDEDQFTFVRNWPRGYVNNSLLIPFRARDLRMVIVLQDTRPHSALSSLKDEGMKQFAAGVAAQASVILTHKERARLDAAKDHMLAEFLNNELRPSACWKAIAVRAAEILSDAGSPLPLDPRPLAQLLRIKDGGLQLVWGDQEHSDVKFTLEESGLRRLELDGCVTGHAVLNNLSVYRCNPRRDHPDLYRGFLFKAAPESELVVLLRSSTGDVLGALNFEHARSEAFKDYHLLLLSHLSDELVPLTTALVGRERRQYNKSTGDHYVIEKILRRMAKTFNHKMGQEIYQTNYALDRLCFQLGESTTAEVNESVALLRKKVAEVQEKATRFLTAVPSFVDVRSLDLIELIDRALAEFDPDAMMRAERIRLLFEPGVPSVKVWTAPILSEHIYNLVSNSLDAIRELQKNSQMGEGLVRITTHKVEMHDAAGNKVAPPRVFVRIEDNGGGIRPDLVDRVIDFGFTSHPPTGTGFGLPAAKEFLQSIHGDLIWPPPGNRYPEGLTLDFYCEEFDPDVHVSSGLHFG
jgi:signal transduction histidine kinase